VVPPVGFVDRQIVDGSEASLHHASRIELPILVSVRAEPVAAVVMPLISEAHGNSVVAEGPEFLDQAIIELLVPFTGEEGDDLRPPVDELRAVTPAAVFGVGQGDPFGVPAVPGVLGGPDLLGGGLRGERRDRRSRSRSWWSWHPP